MESSDTAKASQSISSITHMDTRHLRWATVFASLIAFCKGRDELIPSDLLAGIHVANWERVSGFWPHPELFDDFIAERCDWTEPRWMTWHRWEDGSRNEARRIRLPFDFKISFLPPRTKKRFFGAAFQRSPDWQRIVETGEKLTPYKVPWRGQILPLLTPEVMLLAFIRTENVFLGKHLQGTGLLVDKLEEAAKRYIEKPEKLMF
jgi:hypothetical protein